MSIHTRLVGAFDAIILCTLAAMTVAMMLALLNPSLDGDSSGTMSKRAAVTIEQIA